MDTSSITTIAIRLLALFRLLAYAYRLMGSTSTSSGRRHYRIYCCDIYCCCCTLSCNEQLEQTEVTRMLSRIALLLSTYSSYSSIICTTAVSERTLVCDPSIIQSITAVLLYVMCTAEATDTAVFFVHTLLLSLFHHDQ